MAVQRSEQGVVQLPETAAEAESDDGNLAAAAREDPRAFLPLYDRYYRTVYRFCFARLGTVEAAEDATQDIFLQALRGLRGFRGDGFAAWLFRIAQHVVADVYRWRRRHPAERLDTADQLIDGAQTPEEAALHGAEQEAVRASLAALPDEQRLAIELAAAGLPDAQIALVLARTSDAVKMLRYRGMKRLRHIWRMDASEGTEPRDD